MRVRPNTEFPKSRIQLRSEFFDCCIFASNFISLLTVQSYLCGDGATENSLINIAKRSGTRLPIQLVQTGISELPTMMPGLKMAR